MPASATCPRCGGAFHCGVDDAAPCRCTTLQLDVATLEALRSSYPSCVCVACLASLSAPRVDGSRPLPSSMLPTDEPG